MNKELDKLICLLKNNELIIEYKKMTERINHNTFIMKLLSELNNTRKELILRNSEALKKRYDSLLSKIKNSPELSKYLEYQEVVNNLIQQITLTIETELNN